MKKGWFNRIHLTFVEVIPLNDTREHLLGDECWCGPRLEKVPYGRPDLMIVHHSNDKRELIEKGIVVTSS